MRRLQVLLFLVLAVLVAAQPAVHHHPLFPDSTSEHGLSSRSLSCTVCAAGTVRLQLPTHVVAAPVQGAAPLPLPDEAHVLDGTTASLSSRAPPAA